MSEPNDAMPSSITTDPTLEKGENYAAERDEGAKEIEARMKEGALKGGVKTVIEESATMTEGPTLEKGENYAADMAEISEKIEERRKKTAMEEGALKGGVKTAIEQDETLTAGPAIPKGRSQPTDAEIESTRVFDQGNKPVDESLPSSMTAGPVIPKGKDYSGENKNPRSLKARSNGAPTTGAALGVPASDAVEGNRATIPATDPGQVPSGSQPAVVPPPKPENGVTQR